MAYFCFYPRQEIYEYLQVETRKGKIIEVYESVTGYREPLHRIEEEAKAILEGEPECAKYAAHAYDLLINWGFTALMRLSGDACCQEHVAFIEERTELKGTKLFREMLLNRYRFEAWR